MRRDQGEGRLLPFYRAHRELIWYLFFGGATTVVSVVSFSLLNVGLGVNELVANVISWVLAVLFAFFTNRVWVFAAPTRTWSEFARQLLSFFGGRVATLLVEEAILAVFVTWLGMNSVAVKIVAQILVIVLNYIISKWIVFRKPKKEE